MREEQEAKKAKDRLILIFCHILGKDPDAIIIIIQKPKTMIGKTILQNQDCVNVHIIATSDFDKMKVNFTTADNKHKTVSVKRLSPWDEIFELVPLAWALDRQELFQSGSNDDSSSDGP